MTIKGIDVSTFQGSINWSKVKQSGIQFAMIRGGYGRFGYDEMFLSNYKKAKNVGMPIGVYHYSYANTVDKAKQEAEFVISYLKGKQFEYPIAYDIEDKTLMTLSVSELTSIVKTFCEKLEAAGYYVSIYSGKYWFNDKLNMKILSCYDVWLAQWNTKPTYTGPFGMWQYSSKGIVEGISGRVDMDYAYKDYPSIIKKAGLNGYPSGTPNIQPIPIETHHRGDPVVLNESPLYVSSTASKPVKYVTGIYYLYDGVKIHNRYRITNKKKYAGMTPVASYVTGYINSKELKR